MSVFKYHAFIYFMRPPPWYGTVRIKNTFSSHNFIDPLKRLLQVTLQLIYYANERHKKIPERYNEMAERYKIIGMLPQIIWRSSQFIEKMATNLY